MKRFILDEQRQPVVVEDRARWAHWWSIHGDQASVGFDLVGEVIVTTVLLRETTSDRPFETLVMGGKMDGFALHFATRTEALAAHEATCAAVAVSAKRKSRKR